MLILLLCTKVFEGGSLWTCGAAMRLTLEESVCLTFLVRSYLGLNNFLPSTLSWSENCCHSGRLVSLMSKVATLNETLLLSVGSLSKVFWILIDFLWPETRKALEERALLFGSSL